MVWIAVRGQFEWVQGMRGVETKIEHDLFKNNFHHLEILNFSLNTCTILSSLHVNDHYHMKSSLICGILS